MSFQREDIRAIIAANPNPSQQWIHEALMRPWNKPNPDEKDWAEYSAAITTVLVRRMPKEIDIPWLKPNVRAAENTDPIKRVNNPDDREDYSQYLKRDSAHKGEFCRDEIHKSQD